MLKILQENRSSKFEVLRPSIFVLGHAGSCRAENAIFELILGFGISPRGLGSVINAFYGA